MELLENAVRPYAWGSRTVIAELLGEQVPSPHPQAELWLGAHPDSPSRLVGPEPGPSSLLPPPRMTGKVIRNSRLISPASSSAG